MRVTNTALVAMQWNILDLPILKGTPISMYGVLSNDENAIGIVMEQINFKTDDALFSVMNGGMVDLSELDYELSEEAMGALAGITFFKGQKAFSNAQVLVGVETEAREEADTTLQNNIDTVDGKVGAEVTARTIADDALSLRVDTIQAAVGTPLVAATAADMTDTDKIYVYVGEEEGYTSGNWYYYDGEAWTSGGVYNSTAFETDPTLSIEGMAADAAACGDLKRAINSMSDGKIGYQIVNDSYITTTGVITPYIGWSRTEYLHCDGYKKLIAITGNVSDSQYNAFYDESKTFISKFTILGNTENEFTIPANAVYFICSNNTAAMSKYAFRLEDNRLNDEISALDDKIDAIADYQTITRYISEFPGVIKKTGYSASASSTTITLNELATYDSYILDVNDATVYFANSVISQYAEDGYLSICKIKDPVVASETQFTGTDGARYRNLDENLPSSASPLSLSGAYAIVITVATGEDVAIMSNGIMKSIGEMVLLSQTQLEQVADSVEYNSVEFNGSSFLFSIKNYKLYITHDVNAGIRQNTWRLKRASILKDGVEVDMWNGADADGVVHLDGETDFVGGLHGDEDTTSVAVFIDGEEISTLTAFSSRQFKTFAMFVASNVYHCNESDDAANVAFVRNKVIFIDGEKCAISNCWTASEEVHVNTAYFGMLSVAKALVTNYALNSNYAILDNETSGLGAAYCDRADMFLNSGNVIDYFMSDRSKQEPWGYSVIYDGTGVSDRVKVYFAEIYKTSPEYVTLNQGDVIRATSTMVIH